MKQEKKKPNNNAKERSEWQTRQTFRRGKGGAIKRK
ncbi:hypothetical protein ABES74_02430 [Bacillus subtilis]